MKEIYFATSNQHKLNEIQEIFKNHFIVKSIFDLVDYFEPEECADSFIGNSTIKAVTAGSLVNKPVFADDSGLCIDSLKGFPGVKSARYMEGHTYMEKMETLLKKIDNNRKAYFASAATFYDPKTHILISTEGRVYGSISKDIRGKNGFGYDPFFIPEGFEQTFGELGEEIKNKISHRFNAFDKLKDILYKLGL
ncbi:RdgB/HAM1 family non-canonical purine NTP pyrophosphatase [Geotoga petraea]|jgi:XTP/dITP diphosphohydrolase|uniref:dITP/XTP pyrophosphatase n=1 Tax=Geotoga petraea TaxID=28234 RepID=A0A1G6JMI6_9BACT|nr:RdgB/HAM1 family non-canonical purine NTP pyrophosphatase [Geotoga petraea]MDK2945407.1 XTP/dITP diphosphohydrolase [Geotoga sp.]TGG88264.1 RdgB/HAM1 family non-canonical purine NTP pyrophosphatase [Geotoga petraea]SDC19897.1 dITPase [Geotoga petraea]